MIYKIFWKVSFKYLLLIINKFRISKYKFSHNFVAILLLKFSSATIATIFVLIPLKIRLCQPSKSAPRWEKSALSALYPFLVHLLLFCCSTLRKATIATIFIWIPLKIHHCQPLEFRSWERKIDSVCFCIRFSFVCCYFVAKNHLNFVYLTAYQLFTPFAWCSASGNS